MNTFRDRLKAFRDLPVLKMKLAETTLRLDSLEKVRDTISVENYKTLGDAYRSEIKTLNEKKDSLAAGIDKLRSDINLDDGLLSGEVSIMEEEVKETKLMFEAKALSKKDYDIKLDALEKKINKNKKLISENQSLTSELKFYATHVGTESYLQHAFKKQAQTTQSGIHNVSRRVTGLFTPRNLIILIILALLVSSSIVWYAPAKRIIEERISWNKTIKADTWEAYDSYLLTYPNGKFKNEASTRKDDALWELAADHRNQSSLNSYLENSLNGNHVDEAILLLDSLVWDSISKTGTVNAYQYYLNRFPSGAQNALANSIINKLKTGYLIDERDNKQYKIVNIGRQTWMAENLNYSTSSGSVCLNQLESDCAKFGRLYSQEMARNVCPTGWHLPSKDEYNQLFAFLGDDDYLDDKLLDGGSSGFDASLSGGYLFLPRNEAPYTQGLNLVDYGETGLYWAYDQDWFNKHRELMCFYIAEDFVSIESTDVDEFQDGAVVYLFVRCVKD